MIVNDLRLSFRFLFRNPFYFFVSVFGLGISLAVSTVIIVSNLSELSKDQFHKNGKHTFSLHLELKSPTGQDISILPPPPLYSSLVSNFSEVDMVTRVYTELGSSIELVKGDILVSASLIRVDKDFFNIFDFPLLKGSYAKMDQHSILISEKIANEIFSNRSCVGEGIKFKNGEEYIVQGVLKDFNSISSLHFDFATLTRESDSTDWNGVNSLIYFHLDNGHSIEKVMKQLQVAINDHYGENIFKVIRIPFTKQYFDSPFLERRGNLRSILIGFLIALMILIISLINYVNLSLSVLSKRSREMALRKILGANRINIGITFLSETLIIMVASILISILMFFLVRSRVELLYGISLNIETIPALWIFGVGSVLLAICTIAVTLYPAWVTSRLSLARFLGGGRFATGGIGVRVRTALVVFQFIVSICFLLQVAIIWKQESFMLHKSLGFDKNNLILVKTESNYEKVKLRKRLSSLKTSLMQIQGFEGVSINPMPSPYSVYQASLNGRSVQFVLFDVDREFIEVMRISLKEGRNFSDTPMNEILLNESAANLLANEGFEIGDNLPPFHNKKIVGVTNNFNFQGLYRSVDPLIIQYGESEIQNISIRYSGDLNRRIDMLKGIWGRVFENVGCEIVAFKDEYDSRYLSQAWRLDALFAYSMTAMIISLLGVYSLSSYMIAARKKEMSIRKVQGASSFEIFVLYVVWFLIPILIAILIAIPLGVYFNEEYLNQFSYRVQSSPFLYIGVILVLMVSVILSIAYRCIKASISNPILDLREN